jgi:hypothetical protein
LATLVPNGFRLPNCRIPKGFRPANRASAARYDTHSRQRDIPTASKWPGIARHANANFSRLPTLRSRGNLARDA